MTIRYNVDEKIFVKPLSVGDLVLYPSSDTLDKPIIGMVMKKVEKGTYRVSKWIHIHWFSKSVDLSYEVETAVRYRRYFVSNEGLLSGQSQGAS